MEKAEALMRGYGWTKGKGLGRNEQGIATHVKVARKANTHGIGAKGTEWADDWWDKMYDDTLTKLDVESGEEGEVKVKSTGEARTLEVSIQKYRIAQYKGLLYGNFVKAKKPLVNLLDAQKAEKEKEEKEKEDEQSDGEESTVTSNGRGLGFSNGTDAQEKAKKKAKKAKKEESESESESESDSDSSEIPDYVRHLNSDSQFAACDSMILRKYVPVGKLQRIAMQDAAFGKGGSVASVTKATAAVGQKRKRGAEEAALDKRARKRQKRERKEKREAKRAKKAKKKAKKEANGQQNGDGEAETKQKKKKDKKDKKEKKAKKDTKAKKKKKRANE